MKYANDVYQLVQLEWTMGMCPGLRIETAISGVIIIQVGNRTGPAEDGLLRIEGGRSHPGGREAGP